MILHLKNLFDKNNNLPGYKTSEFSTMKEREVKKSFVAKLLRNHCCIDKISAFLIRITEEVFSKLSRGYNLERF